MKCENERLMERIHELLVGAELREEARESKLVWDLCYQSVDGGSSHNEHICNYILKQRDQSHLKLGIPSIYRETFSRRKIQQFFAV